MRSRYEAGTRAVSINVTASEDAVGVPNLTYPYAGDEFGLAPYAAKLLPRRFTWDVNFGTPANIVSVSLALEGSLDGINWFSLDTYGTAANTMRWVVDKPVRFVRAKIVSLDLTSATSTIVQIGISA